MITADKVLSEIPLNKLLRRLKAGKEKSLLAIQSSPKRSPNMHLTKASRDKVKDLF